MNKKEVWAGGTFLTLYTGFIFAGFSWMLSSKTDPIKENQVRLEMRMDRIEERIGLEMKEIKSLLGQILIAQNTHHKGKPLGKSKKTSKVKLAPRKTASHH